MSMFLLKFKHDDKDWFLHGGENLGFMGSYEKEQAHAVAINNTGKSIGIGGFTITEVKSQDELSKLIGGIPFSIIHFSGGLGIPFWGVEIKNGQ